MFKQVLPLILKNAKKLNVDGREIAEIAKESLFDDEIMEVGREIIKTIDNNSYHG